MRDATRNALATDVVLDANSIIGSAYGYVGVTQIAKHTLAKKDYSTLWENSDSLSCFAQGYALQGSMFLNLLLTNLLAVWLNGAE